MTIRTISQSAGLPYYKNICIKAPDFHILTSFIEKLKKNKKEHNNSKIFYDIILFVKNR